MLQNKNYLFWGIVGAFFLGSVFAALYYRGAFLNYLSRNVGVTSGNGSSSSTIAIPNINTSSSIEDVKDFALKFNAQGSLFLTWTKLSDDTYEVRIFRAKKGGMVWQLWKTIIVHGAPGNQAEINLTKDEAKSLLDYDYFFETRSDNGTTLGVSHVLSFDPNHPDGSGTISTVDTGVEVPPPVIDHLSDAKNPGDTAGTPPPPVNPPPPTTPPNPQTPSSTNPNPPPNTSSTGTGPPPSNNPPPPNGTGGPTYTVYFYTPDGRISSTSTFPTPDQNFWVVNQNGKVQIGWQLLSTSTASLSVSRAPNQSGPWELFFEQERPVLDRPYSIFLGDVGTTGPYYYKLETFNSSQTLLASYGPIYLDPASP